VEEIRSEALGGKSTHGVTSAELEGKKGDRKSHFLQYKAGKNTGCVVKKTKESKSTPLSQKHVSELG